MFQLLYDPLSEIRKCKRQQFGKVLLYLLTASMFYTIGLLFFAWRYVPAKLTPTVIANGLLLVLFGLITAVLVASFFFALAFHVLDGKGGYYEGLSMVVLSIVPEGVFTFFAGALTFAPLGIYVALLLLAYGWVLAFAIFFRSGKELFELDYSGVIAGSIAALVPIVLAGLLAYLLVGM